MRSLAWLVLTGLLGPRRGWTDELAHTNAPGSSNLKRYQDLLQLLGAGIDVITAMNVQHLESVHGLVTSVTGVDVREIVPDEVLDQADDIQPVDLPVGALLDRLQAGKIYPVRAVDNALTGFFREGNLTALRELALRGTAEDVDKKLNDLMFVHGDGLITASVRGLVMVTPDPRWGSVVRSAWRLASALRGEVLAVAIVPDGVLPTADSPRESPLARNLGLAEDLGATIVLVDGDAAHPESMVDAIASLVQRERVSIVVIGVTERPRAVFRRGSNSWLLLAEGLLDRVDHLEVHLISIRAPAPAGG